MSEIPVDPPPEATETIYDLNEEGQFVDRETGEVLTPMTELSDDVPDWYRKRQQA